MSPCTHCGGQHPAGEVTCPVTLEPMSERGPIGGQVDRYLVDSLLGAGGFGGVYRARHVHAGHPVALKILRRELGRDQSMLDRLMREARAAAAIGNPHIIKVLDCGVSSEGRGFVAMELLEGKDLKELYRAERPITVRRAVELVIQALDGLQAAHQANVVHRDVKPANLFVIRENGRELVKVLDFGVSKARAADEISDLTMPGTAMGTPTYMAPEQHSNARDVDGRADLYSISVVLYELLADRPPFEARSFADLIVKVRTTTPTPIESLVPGLPRSLSAAISRGLQRDPSMRWQTAADFAQALRAAINDTAPMLVSATFQPALAEQVRATPALSQPPQVAVEKSRVGMMAAIGAAVALMVLAVAYLAVPRVVAIAQVAPVVVAPVPLPPPVPIAQPLVPVVEAVPAPPAPAPVPVASRPVKKRPTGVVLREPTTMNHIDLNVFDALLQSALPSMEQCRTDEGDETATVQVFINPDGTLPIVQPSAVVENQNREVATCIANRIKRSWRPGLQFGDSGIVSVQAVVPRR